MTATKTAYVETYLSQVRALIKTAQTTPNDREPDAEQEHMIVTQLLPGFVAAVEAVLAVAAKHEHGATRWADPLPVPTWIPELREAVSGGLFEGEQR